MTEHRTNFDWHFIDAGRYFSFPTVLHALEQDHCVFHYPCNMIRLNLPLPTGCYLWLPQTLPSPLLNYIQSVANKRTKYFSTNVPPSWGHDSLLILELIRNTVLLCVSWKTSLYRKRECNLNEAKQREGEIRETPRDRERETDPVPGTLPSYRCHPVYLKK